MKKILVGLLVLFLLAACQQVTSTPAETPVPAAQKAVSLSPTFTQEPTLMPSPAPTSTSVPTATATKAPPTQIPSPVPTSSPTPTIAAGQPITLTSLNMIDEANGWAIDTDQRIVRTVDGGLTWKDVTPKALAAIYPGGAFLNAQSAWVYDNNDPSKGLAHTSDGGKTWSDVAKSLPFQDFSSVTFQNELDGWAETYGVGAGQLYITLYGTHDSGATWSQVMLSSPPDTQSEITGTLHLCNICGDSFYYDPARIIITYGDLNSDPVGKVRLDVSTDLGKTWKSILLPMPSSKYASGLVAPQMPYFYNDKDGYLPFGIIKYNQDSTHAYDVLAIYTTHDGGLTWTTSSTVLENVQGMVGHYVVDFVSPTDAFVACGNDLCVTHDGAKTWQKLPSSLNFTYLEGKAYVQWFAFASSTAGWAITASPEGSIQAYWKTTDGGKTWKEFTPQLK